MSDNNPLFILAGNAGYYNRGCEAITRGTIHILRTFFEEPRFLAVSQCKVEEQFKQDCQYPKRGYIFVIQDCLSGEKELLN